MTRLALSGSDQLGLAVLGVVVAFLGVIWSGPWLDKGWSWVWRQVRKW